jgi:hypothetical protein
VLLDGVPVVLDIALATGSANITVHADGKLSKATQELAREAAISILGLRIDPAPFSAFVKKDKLFGALAKKQPGLRIVQSATVFEALTGPSLASRSTCRLRSRCAAPSSCKQAASTAAGCLLGPGAVPPR